MTPFEQKKTFLNQLNVKIFSKINSYDPEIKSSKRDLLYDYALNLTDTLYENILNENLTIENFEIDYLSIFNKNDIVDFFVPKSNIEEKNEEKTLILYSMITDMINMSIDFSSENKIPIEKNILKLFFEILSFDTLFKILKNKKEVICIVYNNETYPIDRKYLEQVSLCYQILFETFNMFGEKANQKDEINGISSIFHEASLAIDYNFIEKFMIHYRFDIDAYKNIMYWLDEFSEKIIEN